MRARLALAAALFAGAARGQIPADCTGLDHTHERAGYPQSVAWHAKPGRTCKYAVGYIGGACVGRKGEGRASRREDVIGDVLGNRVVQRFLRAEVIDDRRKVRAGAAVHRGPGSGGMLAAAAAVVHRRARLRGSDR